MPEATDHDLLITLVTTVNAMSSKVDSLHTCIKGNGDPKTGLVWRMAEQERIAGERAKRASRIEKLLWGIVGGAATSAAGYVGLQAVHSFNAAPQTQAVQPAMPRE